MSWFNIDKQGLANILERRGKSFALYELIQNAWDSGATSVAVTIDPIPGEPYAKLQVHDNGEGLESLEDVNTMFKRSRRLDNPEKRGRFGLGEKLVLAVCREAQVISKCGSIMFKKDGDIRKSQSPTADGTSFSAEIRMTRDEMDEVKERMHLLLPPVPTVFNGEALYQSKPVATFEVSLPTELVDEEGVLRTRTRQTKVEVFETENDTGFLYELGIPVVEMGSRYSVNVHQKVPLNSDRDNVTPSYMRSINVAVLNNLHEKLSAEDTSAPWVQEAMGDSRAQGEAVKSVVVKRFGENAVIGNPGDPLANATAAAKGFTVVPGGTLSGAAWSNIKKHNTLLPSSVVFPTPKPEQVAGLNQMLADKCPLCGK
jgi:hypothetical protein